MRFEIFVVFAVVLTGCVYITDDSGSLLRVQLADTGYYVEGSKLSVDYITELRAMVKGSIYGSGEMMAVFGTCLDAYDKPVLGSYGLFSAWYPNGSVYLTNYTMDEIQTGYFMYSGPMEAVQGTYLTQMECRVVNSSDSALAFGEWQNPYWVKRIELLNDSLVDLSAQLDSFEGNITVQLGDIAFNITNAFAITWDVLSTINTTLILQYQNLSEQLYLVGQIANASVDRNDSLIMQFLYNLTSLVVPANNTGNPVNWTETPGRVIYYSSWVIRVDTFDPVDTSRRVFWPDVSCIIWDSQSNVNSPMTPVGNHFTFSTFINTMSSFTWLVQCYYN